MRRLPEWLQLILTIGAVVAAFCGAGAALASCAPYTAASCHEACPLGLVKTCAADLIECQPLPLCPAPAASAALPAPAADDVVCATCCVGFVLAMLVGEARRSRAPQPPELDWRGRCAQTCGEGLVKRCETTVIECYPPCER